MNNVSFNDKQNWVLNEIVYPEDTNRWEKGIADVVALANYLNTTDIPQLRAALSNLQNNSANKDLSNISPAASQRLIPVGAVIPGPVTELEGFLLCNGQAVSRTDYAELYAKIGTNFGFGDDSTTFNVPDYRGCFLRGFGGDSAVDMYTKQPMGAPNIYGYVTKIVRGQDAYGVDAGGALSWQEYVVDSDGGESRKGGSIIVNAANSNSAYGAANEIRPVNFAINYFIKF